MWEIASVLVFDIDTINKFLTEGFEPFAVTTDMLGRERIWLKRSQLDEIHSEQSKPVQRRSRRVAPETKD